MTLARKMAWWSLALIVGLTVLAAAALWGLAGLNRDLGSALAEYESLRRYYEIGLDVARARELLAVEQADPGRAADRVWSARLRLDEAPADAANGRVRERLDEALRQIESRSPTAAVTGTLNSALNDLSALSNQTRAAILAVHDAGRARMQRTVAAIAALSAALIVASVVIGIRQYRAVMRPLRRLGAAVRHVAAGRFDRRVPAAGDHEFAELSADFNRMADELDGLYRSLEEKVAASSRELVRSERLASVGYLAAGVAHEINNPLGIIAGYAEMTLRALEKHDAGTRGRGDTEKEARRALEVIAEEAFRCKKITEKLLALSRGGDGPESREPVSLAHVADDVAQMVAGLRRFDGRKLVIAHDPPDQLVVSANPAQMKQVLLNLVVNAMEALDAASEGGGGGGGEVRIDCRRIDARVRLTVTDNGRGMTPETLERAFEPFFTAKRGHGDPASVSGAGAGGGGGTGLGLSITHVIVREHGGTIRAHSDGPGRGSRFVVELPALTPVATTPTSVDASSQNRAKA